MEIMYPAADIPCVQLSLMSNLSAAEHIRIGRALSELREKNVLVVGPMGAGSVGALLSPQRSASG